MNLPADPRDPSTDPLDDLLSRALVSRAAGARPGEGSLLDVRQRVRRRSRRRTAVGATAVAGLGLVGVGVVLVQGDDSPAPIRTADGNTDAMPEGGTGGGAWRCWDPVAPMVAPGGPLDMGPATTTPMTTATGPVATEAPVDATWPADRGPTTSAGAGPATTAPMTTASGPVATEAPVDEPIVSTIPSGLPGEGWFAQCEWVLPDGTPATVVPTTISCPSAGCIVETTAVGYSTLDGLRIVVANGTGVGGLAGSVAETFTRYGASAEAANAEGIPDSTSVFVVSDREAAVRVAEVLFALGLTPRVAAVPTESLAGMTDGDLTGADVLVVLGPDAVVALTGSGTTPTTAPATCSTHVVQTGDSLAGIALLYRTTIADVAALNEWPEGIDHVLLPGEVLAIPGPGCLPLRPTTTTSTP